MWSLPVRLGLAYKNMFTVFKDLQYLKMRVCVCVGVRFSLLDLGKTQLQLLNQQHLGRMALGTLGTVWVWGVQKMGAKTHGSVINHVGCMI